MPKKVKVNKDVCIGCGLCAGLAPSVFVIEDDGKAAAVAEGDEEEVVSAQGSCPVGAIEDDD